MNAPYSTTPIPELALDLARKGMEDNAVNLRALGAHPDAAAYWEKWRKERANDAVDQALRKIREEAKCSVSA